MDYFSVDVESSGPAPGIHNLLSIGVTHVRRHGGRYVLFDDFYLEVKPVFPKFEAAAMRICGLDAERLRLEGTEPEEAMGRLSEWVRAQQKNIKDRPVFVAQNAPFDWMFIAWYFAYAEVPNPFGHSALDMKPLSMGKLGLSWVETSLKNIASKLDDVAERDTANLHHAGHDARYQAEVFAALMNLNR